MRFFYGWIIAGAAFLSWAISIGPRQAFSVFLLAFMQDFGWSRTATAAAFSVHMASYALGGCALGLLLDRVGPRRVIAWSTGAWVLILLLCSRIERLWHLYLIFGVVGGIAMSGLAYVPNNTLLSRWFIRYRGLATGIAQAGVPFGTAMFGVLAQLGTASIGWRSTYVGFGLLVAVTALPLVLFFLRDDPGLMGLTPDGIPAAPANAQGPPAASTRVAQFTGPGYPGGYWSVFGANILRGMTMYAILIHQVAYLVDTGFTRMAAASLYSLGSILAVPSGLAAGLISDRLGRPRTYAVIAGLYVIGYASLLLVRDSSHIVFLGPFILASGMAMGANTPVFAAFLTDRLQGPRLGFLLGLQNIGFGAGAMLGPFLAGVLFDRLGSYTLAFSLMGGSIVLSSIIVTATAGRRPRNASG
ncbi:MAG TPA: MFS transporter [Candidatus Methylomirabilis sp.]|nr:MFS transporter [Candidatus Methylomirabilis sp.]